MISPIGSFLTRMDAATTGGMDTIIGAMTSAMATPIISVATAYYIIQGAKLANGDTSVMYNFVPRLIKVGLVVWLSTNLTTFNTVVRDTFFTTLPGALANTIAGATGSTGGSPTSLPATAAIFDTLWAQLISMVGTLFSQVGISVTGVLAGIAAIGAALAGGLGLAIMAMVYVTSRLVLAAVICLSPVLIGCALFEATMPFFERAVGKVVALILLQTFGFILLQIVLAGDQWFMAQATTAIQTALSNGSVMVIAIEALISMVVWLLAGAYAIYNLKAVAYSIGTGISLSGPSAYTAMLLGRALGGGGGGDRTRSPSSAPESSLSLSLAPRGALSGSSSSGGAPALARAQAALPPPPPPAITQSTRG